MKVANVAKIIELDYIDPFGLDAEKESLVNIASGMSLADDITPEVLKQVEKGKELAKDFTDNRLITSNVKFHNPIKKNDCKSFKISKKVVVVKTKTGAQACAEVNRNIF